MFGKVKCLKFLEGLFDCVYVVLGWVYCLMGKEFVVSGNGYGILSLWTVRVGKSVAEFGFDDGGYWGVIYIVCDNEGVIVIGGVDGCVLVWYVNEEGQFFGLLEEFSVYGYYTGVVLCAASIRFGFVCMGGVDGCVLVWDIKV